MNKHEDQFFEMFRSSLKDFSPEVPDAIYAGVRSKMKRKNFFAFSWNSLNFWYLAMAGGAVAAVLTVDGPTDQSMSSLKSIEQMDEMVYKPNNALFATMMDEEEGTENVIELVDNKTIEYHEVAQGVSIGSGDDSQGQNIGDSGDQNNPFDSSDLNNGDLGEDPMADAGNEHLEGCSTKEDMVEAPVKEALPKRIFNLTKIGKLNLNLKKEIEEKDEVIIYMPVSKKQ